MLIIQRPLSPKMTDFFSQDKFFFLVEMHPMSLFFLLGIKPLQISIVVNVTYLRQQKPKHPPSNSHCTCISQKCFITQSSTTCVERLAKRKSYGIKGPWSSLPGPGHEPRLIHPPRAEHLDMPRSTGGHTHLREGTRHHSTRVIQFRKHRLKSQLLTLCDRPKDATQALITVKVQLK